MLRIFASEPFSFFINVGIINFATLLMCGARVVMGFFINQAASDRIEVFYWLFCFCIALYLAVSCER